MNQLLTRTSACFAYCLLIFGSLFFAHRLPAQLNYLTSTEDGSSYEVCLEGDYLYVGAANTLKVYSLNGPGNTPDSNTFSLRLPSNIDQILVRNGYLYICANHAGLWKFDISGTPERPDSVTKYVPASINESIYDVAFYGDTLVVAAKHKVMMLLDSGGVITYLNTIDTYSGTQRVHGVAVKGNLLAYTVATFFLNDPDDGVYLVDLTNLQQLDFYHQADADPWEVYFGENDSLLHVMGGNYLFTFNGLYYALDYSNPNSMQLKFSDNLPGYPIVSGIATPMSAKLIHDTVYVATQGAASADSSSCCFVYVYDATNPDSIRLIEDLTGGLYHFDIDIDETSRAMYVASEWYGVLTVDISDISNDTVLGKTLTGGWCSGSSYAGNRLVEASEGFGVRLFDMTYPQNPVLIATDTAVGFCRAISIDDSAQFVYAWYLTEQRFRVYEADSLNLIADIGGPPFELFLKDFTKSRIHGNFVAVIQIPTLGIHKIFIADVADPYQPVIHRVRPMDQVQDLAFHASGKLIACSEDSIIVFDPNTMQALSSVVPPDFDNDFRCIAISNDTLYAVYFYDFLNTNRKIARYLVNPSSFALTPIDDEPFSFNTEFRAHLATNDTVLYFSSSLDQLKAISKRPPYSVLATYDHSADHMLDHEWGVTDLYYAQGLLILNEYMGQSSIFDNPVLVSTPDPIAHEKGLIYPNPVHDRFALQLEASGPGSLEVFDLQGRKHYATTTYPMGSAISTDGWQSGIYFVVWQQGDLRWTGKMVKLE